MAITRQVITSLQHLLSCDMGLAGRAEMLRAMLDGKDGAWMVEKSADIQSGLKSIVRLHAAFRPR